MSGKPYPSTAAQARRPLVKRGKATPPDYPIDASEALRIAGRYPKPRSAELGERKRMTLAIATAMSNLRKDWGLTAWSDPNRRAFMYDRAEVERKKIEQLTAIEHET